MAWLDRPTPGPRPHSNVAPICVVCCIHTAAVRRPNELRLSRFVDAGSPARCSDLTAKPTHGLAQLGGRPQLAHSASASAGRHDGPMAAECHMPICHMLPELRGVANGLMGPPARTGWLGTCASVAVPPGRPCPRPSGARRGEWRLVLEPCGATASLRPPCGAHTPPSPFCAGGWPARSTAAKPPPESVRALCPVWVRARVRGSHIRGCFSPPSAALRRKVP